MSHLLSSNVLPKRSDFRRCVKHFQWNKTNHQPLTGQSVSEDRHRPRPTSCRSPEHWGPVPSRPPASGETNQPTCERSYSAQGQLLPPTQSCYPLIEERRSPVSRRGAEFWQNGGEKHQQSRRIFQCHVALGDAGALYCFNACLYKRTAGRVCLSVCLWCKTESEIFWITKTERSGIKAASEKKKIPTYSIRTEPEQDRFIHFFWNKNRTFMPVWTSLIEKLYEKEIREKLLLNLLCDKRNTSRLDNIREQQAKLIRRRADG